MYYKNFKDCRISALGLGSLRLPVLPEDPSRIDRNRAAEVIDQAFACGINYFDTAFTYHKTDSEAFLGEALSRYPRDSYYLASKFYVGARTDLEQVFEEQLRRCRTDYFDFYLFHSVQEQFFDDYMDPARDYLGYLLKQKAAGRIRYLGFSSHAHPEGLEQFLDWYPDFDMALIQLNYLDWTLLDGQRQYEILAQRGIPVWVMEPLKGGRLVRLNQEAEALLHQAAPDQSTASWSFRYLMGLEHVQCVLSGMSTPAQIRENAGLFRKGNALSPSERQTLEQAVRLFRDSFGVPCSSCRYCCPVCPAGLDIPALIQGYNELTAGGEPWKLHALSRISGPEACLQCGACALRCPQRIDIPSVMKKYCQLKESADQN